MLRIDKVRALDRLLLEHFGGKVGRGLALAGLPTSGTPPAGRNLYLSRSSLYAARPVTTTCLVGERRTAVEGELRRMGAERGHRGLDR
jgi:hypothetical protein